jgi:hypothetical protein
MQDLSRKVNPLNETGLALPFPGKYPTRWYVWVRGAHSKTLLRYTGKPNRTIAQMVMKLIYIPEGQLLFEEFDRGSLVRDLRVYLPRFGLQPGQCNHSLLRLYYPALLDGDVLLPWVNTTPRFFKMELGKHSWGAYLPHGELNRATMEGYAQWVHDTKFQWKR